LSRLMSKSASQLILLNSIKMVAMIYRVISAYCNNLIFETNMRSRLRLHEGYE